MCDVISARTSQPNRQKLPERTQPHAHFGRGSAADGHGQVRRHSRAQFLGMTGQCGELSAVHGGSPVRDRRTKKIGASFNLWGTALGERVLVCRGTLSLMISDKVSRMNNEWCRASPSLGGGGGGLSRGVPDRDRRYTTVPKIEFSVCRTHRGTRTRASSALGLLPLVVRWRVSIERIFPSEFGYILSGQSVGRKNKD